MNADASPKVQEKTSMFVPNATVFVASACIMVVEILSTRLVARYLGSSVYTWTSAIGVVLAGISIGNYMGGRFADRFHPRRTLAVLFVLCSFGCLILPPLNRLIGEWEGLRDLSWPARVFTHFVVAFLIPATLLGTISPVVAKVALSMGRATGRTIGTIYAWGAAGSIFGTFLAGFYLIDWIGSTVGTVYAVAVVLALMGVAYGYKSWVPYAYGTVCAAAVVCALAPWSTPKALGETLWLREAWVPDLIFVRDSDYQRVAVYADITNNPARRMVLDRLVHSYANLRDPLELKYDYERVYNGVVSRLHGSGDPVTAMVIGGGGYTYPHYLELTRPGSYIEVSEIDPVVTEAAHEAFGLPRDTSMDIFNMDARNRVEDLIAQKNAGQEVPEFDLIFGDSISHFAVPFHLTTVEFNRYLYDLLADNGVYMLNMIDALDLGYFLGAVINTCKEVFPHVYVFDTTGFGERRSTFVVVAAKQPLDLSDVTNDIKSRTRFGGSLLTDEQTEELASKNGGLVLTDDFAPVDSLLAEVVRREGAEIESEEHRFGNTISRLIVTGEIEKAKSLCEDALAKTPNDPESCFRMGMVFEAEENFDAAMNFFRRARQLEPTSIKFNQKVAFLAAKLGMFPEAEAVSRMVVNADPMNTLMRGVLGTSLRGLNRLDEAIEQFEEIARLKPGFLDNRFDLGMALLQAGRPSEALVQFQAIVELQEDYPDGYRGLGQSCILLGRYEEAIKYLDIELEHYPDNWMSWQSKGVAFSQLNRLEDAVECYRKACEIAPNNHRLKTELEHLQQMLTQTRSGAQ